MFQRIRIPLAAKLLCAAGATALLIALPAVADDMGGESAEVPPPASEPSPEPMAAEPEATEDTEKDVQRGTRWTPIQVSIVPPVQIFQDPTREVWGLRMNLPYGEWGTVNGFDIGIGNILTGNLRGIQAGIANYVEGSAYGAQIGGVNWVGEDFIGFQVGGLNMVEGDGIGAQLGFVNDSGTHTGLQIGLANIAGSLKGIQIGAFNINKSGEPLSFLPVINIGF